MPLLPGRDFVQHKPKTKYMAEISKEFYEGLKNQLFLKVNNPSFIGFKQSNKHTKLVES